MQSIQPSALVFPSLSSKRGWKGVERVSEDITPQLCQAPIPSPRVDGIPPSPSATISRNAPCSVCQEHQPRYTCPQCQIPYCSVQCYRNHTSGSNQQASPCSESFYKNRLSSILDLEAKEQKDNTHKMLRDHYQMCRDDQELSEEILSDQLYDLLQLLEEQQDDSHTMSHSQMLALMPPALRAHFQRDLNEGRLQEMILEKWFPWWRRQLGTADSNDDDDDELATIGAFIRTGLSPSKITTIDERLMKIPMFTTICRRPQPFRVLLYSLIDILYAYCWTMRLYHGIPNVLVVPTCSAANKTTASAAEDDVTVDAAVTLMQASSTLGKDDRYLSLEHVLISSTSASTRAYPDGCNAEWSILVEDCALIVASHSLVGRALLETSDLFKAAIRCLKYDLVNVASSSVHKETISKLRQLRKKLEFFLSWSQHTKSEFSDAIKDEMMQWSQLWNADQFAADKLSDVLDELHLRDAVVARMVDTAPTDRSDKSPFIVEMSSI